MLLAFFHSTFERGRQTVWFLRLISPSHIVQNKTASAIILPLLVRTHCITASPKCLRDRAGNATLALMKSPIILACKYDVKQRPSQTQQSKGIEKRANDTYVVGLRYHTLTRPTLDHT